MPDQPVPQLERIVPLLQVSNMEDTLAYYHEVLGFSVEALWPEDGPPKWAQVSRAGVSLAFTIDLGTSTASFIAEKGNGVVFYVILAEVAALYEELSARGAIIVQDLATLSARQQFSVADVNGYVLAFTQGLR
jgi:uncharacterized glyoxalase superfamily protein PhnB